MRRRHLGSWLPLALLACAVPPTPSPAPAPGVEAKVAGRYECTGTNSPEFAFAEGTLVLAADRQFAMSFTVAAVSDHGREAELAAARAEGWPLTHRGTWHLDGEQVVMEATERNGELLPAAEPLPVLLWNGDIEYHGPCLAVRFRRVAE